MVVHARPHSSPCDKQQVECWPGLWAASVPIGLKLSHVLRGRVCMYVYSLYCATAWLVSNALEGISPVWCGQAALTRVLGPVPQQLLLTEKKREGAGDSGREMNKE